MTQINDGGPAFPVHDNSAYYLGMSLRDWFAGKAMNAWYASFDARDMSTGDNDLIADAFIFYRVADAMLNAREAKP